MRLISLPAPHQGSPFTCSVPASKQQEKWATAHRTAPGSSSVGCSRAGSARTRLRHYHTFGRGHHRARHRHWRAPPPAISLCRSSTCWFCELRAAPLPCPSSPRSCTPLRPPTRSQGAGLRPPSRRRRCCARGIRRPGTGTVISDSEGRGVGCVSCCRG